MSNIHKKLIVLFSLYIICAQVKAQVTGTPPQQADHGTQRAILAQKRDYASVVADFRRRYPEIPVQAKPELQRDKNHTKPNNNTSYEAVRQQLIQRYPELQQQLTQKPVTAGSVKAEPRSYEWCVKNLLPRIQAMQKASQEDAQQ